MESWFLDGKKSNSAEMLLVNFLAHSLQHRHTISKDKNFEKNRFFSPNPLKIRFLGYFSM